MDGFARRLLDWYDRHGRHDLPWQDTPTNRRTPYRVWISEVMLQQTRVATVIPYFQRFLDTLPHLRALAAADEDKVLALWSGLGYYRRARHLHAAAKLCVTQHGGWLPREFEALAALPGIGRSTAGAILALAYGRHHAILDGNVKRVLCRYHGVQGWPGERSVENTLWAHAEAHTPATRIDNYTQAIMDLGATVCTRTRPDCEHCPQRRTCVAHQEGLTASLPTPRLTRVLPERRTIFIVLRDRRNRVLLQRRPPQGVWPGLWSLPEAASEGDAMVAAVQRADLDGHPGHALPTIRHAFTHYKLQASPIEWRRVLSRATVADAPGLRWCSRAQIAALGLPAPVRRLLLAVNRDRESSVPSPQPSPKGRGGKSTRPHRAVIQ